MQLPGCAGLAGLLLGPVGLLCGALALRCLLRFASCVLSRMVFLRLVPPSRCALPCGVVVLVPTCCGLGCARLRVAALMSLLCMLLLGCCLGPGVPLFCGSVVPVKVLLGGIVGVGGIWVALAVLFVW